jgi:hypothetical protein
MHAAQIHARFRGVVCKIRGKPIQPASLINRETSIKAEAKLAVLASKVFKPFAEILLLNGGRFRF